MSKNIEITLKRSVIGSNDKHKKIVKSLGLTKLNQSRTYPDNEAIRGMVKHVSHLLDVKEI